ncbi:HNH endonuclease [Piscinibacter sp. Jin2]|uniref:HNH endonuclease n=1 Tax=Aquariibacter lacus TaxID=2801332 RepID=A0A9X0XFM3_9BURK|nr:HNH endonuclease [Piscinibacter lacus]
MPTAAPKPCTVCGRTVAGGGSRCELHPKQAWAKPEGHKRRAGWWLHQQRVRLFRRAPWCVHCERQGLKVLATQRDHIVPLSEGGLDEEANTQGLCDGCHQVKSEVERLRAIARRRGGGR